MTTSVMYMLSTQLVRNVKRTQINVLLTHDTIGLVISLKHLFYLLTHDEECYIIMIKDINFRVIIYISRSKSFIITRLHLVAISRM